MREKVSPEEFKALKQRVAKQEAEVIRLTEMVISLLEWASDSMKAEKKSRAEFDAMKDTVAQFARFSVSNVTNIA